MHTIRALDEESRSEAWRAQSQPCSCIFMHFSVFFSFHNLKQHQQQQQILQIIIIIKCQVVLPQLVCVWWVILLRCAALFLGLSEKGVNALPRWVPHNGNSAKDLGNKYKNLLLFYYCCCFCLAFSLPVAFLNVCTRASSDLAEEHEKITAAAAIPFA